MKPPSHEDERGPVNIEDVPISPTPFASSHESMLDSPRPKSIERLEICPQSAQSHGLKAPTGSQPGEGSSIPRSGDQPQACPSIAKSLWDNPYFIWVGFHIGWFITVSVNTEAEWENIKALYARLETTSVQINVHT
jgi:hypothetical protein